MKPKSLAQFVVETEKYHEYNIHSERIRCRNRNNSVALSIQIFGRMFRTMDFTFARSFRSHADSKDNMPKMNSTY